MKESVVQHKNHNSRRNVKRRTLKVFQKIRIKIKVSSYLEKWLLLKLYSIKVNQINLLKSQKINRKQRGIKLKKPQRSKMSNKLITYLTCLMKYLHQSIP